MKNLRELTRRYFLASSRIDEIYFNCLKKVGIKQSELCLMYALDSGESLSQKQICSEWMMPKTTLNTIICQFQNLGYLTLEGIPGKRREMNIRLTETGKAYAKELLSFVYTAENEAMRQVLQRYDTKFIEAHEYYSECLLKTFESQLNNKN